MAKVIRTVVRDEDLGHSLWPFVTPRLLPGNPRGNRLVCTIIRDRTYIAIVDRSQ
jgi:hypothetical protein